MRDYDDEGEESVVEEHLDSLGDDWSLAGFIGVDAGVVWIGDPCYCVTPDTDSHPAKTWPEFCDKLEAAPNKEVVPFSYKGETMLPGGTDSNLGIVVHTAHGDGSYPVFVKKNRDGQVSSVTIMFE